MKPFDDAAVERLCEMIRRRPAIEIDAPQLRRACVLIPLIRDNGWSLLFSRRADNLAEHSGQIAFPGGRVEPGESLEDAAIREAEEEVGIPARNVELIGRLDDVIAGNTRFLVAPFAGIVHDRVEYVLQAGEVAEVFEVPVEKLLDPSLPQVRYVSYLDRPYPAYFYPYGPHEIWGLTGRMLKAFLDLVWMAL